MAALQAGGFTVYAIDPRAVARYRERSAQPGGKSDPGDAIVLANILRTDRQVHRPLPEITELGLAVKALARQHQEAIWARPAHREPPPLVAVRVLRQCARGLPAPDPQGNSRGAAGSSNAGSRREAHPQAGRHSAAPERAGRPVRPRSCHAHLHQPALRQPPRVEAALGHAVVGLVNIVETMQESIAELEAAMAVEFDQHPSAELLRADLALEDLEMAIWSRQHDDLAGLVHHSNRDVQNLSIRCTGRLAEAGRC